MFPKNRMLTVSYENNFGKMTELLLEPKNTPFQVLGSVF